MNRPMILKGWYPFNEEECAFEIKNYIDNEIFLEGITPISAIVPHAGWYFCGKLAINTIKILKAKNGVIKNVFIFGGHLSPTNLPIIETFSKAQTPIGNLTNDKEIVDEIVQNFQVQTMNYFQDNTVEILLPLVRYFFGDVKITALYLPPNLRIITPILDFITDNYSSDTVFIGSTDLTHYGANYGFLKLEEEDPVKWVKEKNDKRYINLLMSLKGETSIDYALNNKAACSPGAAYGALYVAKKQGVTKAELIGYSTSYDVRKDENFVGYTGIIY